MWNGVGKQYNPKRIKRQPLDNEKIQNFLVIQWLLVNYILILGFIQFKYDIPRNV